MGREKTKNLLYFVCGVCLIFLVQSLFDDLASAGTARIWIAVAIVFFGVGALCLIVRGLYGLWNQKRK